MVRTRGFVTFLAVALVVAAWLPQPLGHAAPAGTYTVTSTADSGVGTLREAIDWANSNLGADEIHFGIPESGCPVGVCTIALSSPLPAVTSINGTTIDGYTQPGAAVATGFNPATLKIVVNGNGYDCFTLTGANHVIRGLVIQNCNYGVRIEGGGATGNVVEGNHIGTNAAGSTANGNQHAGVYIGAGATYNTVGGDGPAARNVISGNDNYGVWLEYWTTMYNTVSGNYIGTGAGGALDLGNGYSGVQILNARYNTIGGDTTGERNVIAGNDRHGVFIRGSSAIYNVVSGNIIGGARDAADDVANTWDGVRIEDQASYTTIGGPTAGEGNLILGNGQDGVGIEGSDTSDNVVAGNLIGLNQGDWSWLGNVNGVHIRDGAQNNTIGGDTEGARNIISANRGYGVYIEGSGTTGNVVAGNYIGTGINGSYAPAELGNDQDGVILNNGASGNTVGGAAAGERNVIANNDWSGVAIYGSGTAGNMVLGNYVGLDAAGTAARGNRLIGVYLGPGASGNAVGGDTAGERNLIAGNVGDGVQVQGAGAVENVVSGNWIGLRPDGATMANGGDGVRIFDGACRNRVGGPVAGEGNVISGNGLSGVSIYGTGTMTNTVVGNHVGTSAGGTAAAANALYGVYLGAGATSNTIGGATAGERNLISGNTQDGVRIEHSGTSDNQVAGNDIGTDASGGAGLANGWDGVRITGGAQRNTIGGSVAGEGNLISGNSDYGVRLDGASTRYNTISGNQIGTTASGASALGNSEGGILITEGAAYNLVGGRLADERNVISGNFWGVGLTGSGTSFNEVLGNAIGLSASGLAAVPNTYVGVYVASGAHHNAIGGPLPGEGNVISGNAYHGVSIFGTGADDNTVEGNRIGTDAGGSAPLGNGWEGVSIYGNCDRNVIGPGNLVAYNGQNGVVVDQAGASGNRITQNSIHANSAAGIDLRNGANGDVATPAITAVTYGSSVSISGTACGGCTVELFQSTTDDGQGELYLGSTAASSGGAFTLVVGALAQPYLTATATDPSKGTSEFSAVYEAPVLFRVHLPLLFRGWAP